MVSFVQTARCGSFVKAAEGLGVSAVAVSRNVARLEKQLGVRLFVRTTRNLAMTAEGRSLLARCEGPLGLLDVAFKEARLGADAPAGMVRVTAVSPFVRDYLAPTLADFHTKFPNVALDIHCSEQVSEMISGGFDVGVRVGKLDDAGYVARPLGPLALALCAAPDFDTKFGPFASLSELARRHGLGLKPNGSQHPAPWWLQVGSTPEQVPVSGPLVCNDIASLAAACATGLGVAQLPLVAALPLLRAGKLTVLHPECSPQDLQLFLHYPDRQLSARVRAFVDFVIETSRSHSDLLRSPHEFASSGVAGSA